MRCKIVVGLGRDVRPNFGDIEKKYLAYVCSLIQLLPPSNSSFSIPRSKEEYLLSSRLVPRSLARAHLSTAQRHTASMDHEAVSALKACSKKVNATHQDHQAEIVSDAESVAHVKQWIAVARHYYRCSYLQSKLEPVT